MSNKELNDNELKDVNAGGGFGIVTQFPKTKTLEKENKTVFTQPGPVEGSKTGKDYEYHIYPSNPISPDEFKTTFEFDKDWGQ